MVQVVVELLVAWDREEWEAPAEMGAESSYDVLAKQIIRRLLDLGLR